MKRLVSFAFAVGAATLAFAATYKNPILTMDFSDPDVCLGGDGRFYMTASSFGGLPGLPILVSEDLVNWKYAAYALQRHPFETTGPEHGNCVWAPSIRYNASKKEYVIYWGDPDRGAYRVSAKDPAGPWSEPRLVVPAKGLIDTCPLYDDDGRVYLVNGWANSRAGMNSVLTVRELDADETKAISDPVMVYDGVPEGNFTAEGPKFYKHNGEYWVFFPAGGVGQGWQVAMRGPTPFGPYTARTVMAQGSSSCNGPHQGGWVCNDAGEDWFVHFSDRDAYGRIVYLEPLEWKADGWPMIGVDEDGDGCGQPVDVWPMPKRQDLANRGLGKYLPAALKRGDDKNAAPPPEGQWLYPQLDDEFDSTTPGLQWQWLGKDADFAGWCTPYGYYRMYSTPYGDRLATDANTHRLAHATANCNTWEMPGIMVQKFPAFEFTATLKAQCGAKQADEEAGIIIQGLDYARLGLKYNGQKEFEIVYTECFGADKGKPEKQTILGKVPAVVIGAGIRTANVKDVWLKVAVRKGEVARNALAPTPMCTFFYSFDGENWTAANAGQPFPARQGKWIGATVGLYAVSAPNCKDRGWIDADWFRIAR